MIILLATTGIYEISQCHYHFCHSHVGHHYCLCTCVVVRILIVIDTVAVTAAMLGISCFMVEMIFAIDFFVDTLLSVLVFR